MADEGRSKQGEKFSTAGSSSSTRRPAGLQPVVPCLPVQSLPVQSLPVQFVPPQTFHLQGVAGNTEQQQHSLVPYPSSHGWGNRPHLTGPCYAPVAYRNVAAANTREHLYRTPNLQPVPSLQLVRMQAPGQTAVQQTNVLDGRGVCFYNQAVLTPVPVPSATTNELVLLFNNVETQRSETISTNMARQEHRPVVVYHIPETPAGQEEGQSNVSQLTHPLAVLPRPLEIASSSLDGLGSENLNVLGTQPGTQEAHQPLLLQPEDQEPVKRDSSLVNVMDEFQLPQDDLNVEQFPDIEKLIASIEPLLPECLFPPIDHKEATQDFSLQEMPLEAAKVNKERNSIGCETKEESLLEVQSTKEKCVPPGRTSILPMTRYPGNENLEASQVPVVSIHASIKVSGNLQVSKGKRKTIITEGEPLQKMIRKPQALDVSGPKGTTTGSGKCKSSKTISRDKSKKREEAFPQQREEALKGNSTKHMKHPAGPPGLRQVQSGGCSKQHLGKRPYEEETKKLNPQPSGKGSSRKQQKLPADPSATRKVQSDGCSRQPVAKRPREEEMKKPPPKEKIKLFIPPEETLDKKYIRNVDQQPSEPQEQPSGAKRDNQTGHNQSETVQNTCSEQCKDKAKTNTDPAENQGKKEVAQREAESVKPTPKSNLVLQMMESVQVFYPLGKSNLSALPSKKTPAGTSSVASSCTVPEKKPTLLPRPVPRILPPSTSSTLSKQTSSKPVSISDTKPSSTSLKPPVSGPAVLQAPQVSQASMWRPSTGVLPEHQRAGTWKPRDTQTRVPPKTSFSVTHPSRLPKFPSSHVGRSFSLVQEFNGATFIPWRTPPSDQEVSTPITEEQRPIREMMKRRAQKEREEAACWTSVGRVKFFAEREKEMNTFIRFGYPRWR